MSNLSRFTVGMRLEHRRQGRTVVIVATAGDFRGEQRFLVRNVKTGRQSNVGFTTLRRDFVKEGAQ